MEPTASIGPETYLQSFMCYSWNTFFHVVLKRDVLSISL